MILPPKIRSSNGFDPCVRERLYSYTKFIWVYQNGSLLYLRDFRLNGKIEYVTLLSTFVSPYERWVKNLSWETQRSKINIATSGVSSISFDIIQSGPKCESSNSWKNNKICFSKYQTKPGTGKAGWTRNLDKLRSRGSDVARGAGTWEWGRASPSQFYVL